MYIFTSVYIYIYICVYVDGRPRQNPTAFRRPLHPEVPSGISSGISIAAINAITIVTITITITIIITITFTIIIMFIIITPDPSDYCPEAPSGSSGRQIISHMCVYVCIYVYIYICIYAHT